MKLIYLTQDFNIDKSTHYGINEIIELYPESKLDLVNRLKWVKSDIGENTAIVTRCPFISEAISRKYKGNIKYYIDNQLVERDIFFGVFANTMRELIFNW